MIRSRIEVLVGYGNTEFAEQVKIADWPREIVPLPRWQLYDMEADEDGVLSEMRRMV